MRRYHLTYDYHMKGVGLALLSLRLANLGVSRTGMVVCSALIGHLSVKGTRVVTVTPVTLRKHAAELSKGTGRVDKTQKEVSTNKESGGFGTLIKTTLSRP
jgi:hypothetical protein